MAAKYGPFVRFYPGGSEEAGAPEDISDDQAAEDVINDAEPKVEDSPEFKGLLRDRQSDRATLSHINAENAAYKQEVERLRRQVADTQRPTDEEPELSEDEASEGVTRGEFRKTLRATLGKSNTALITEVTKLIDSRDARTSQVNLKKNQAADAQTLMRTHTAKTKGATLDAKTVVDETIAFMSVNQPELLEFLTKQPDYASLIYKIGTGEPLVPTLGQRVTLRRNTLLAQQLDDKDKDLPGGGAPSGDDLSVFEAILSSDVEMTDETLDKMHET